MNYVIVYIGVSTKDPLLLNKRSVYTIRPTYTVMALKFLYYFLDRLTGFPSLICIMFLWTNLLLINSKHIFLFFFHIIINLITLIKINKIIMKKFKGVLPLFFSTIFIFVMVNIFFKELYKISIIFSPIFKSFFRYFKL